MDKIINYFTSAIFFESIIVILISLIIYLAINKFIFNDKSLFKFSIGTKSTTFIHMLKSSAKYGFIIITTLIVLQMNGIKVTSLLAGVGILSVVLGLAMQETLKDMIRGLTILSDSYFTVDDVIEYNGIEGKVLAIGLRTTKIKDIVDGDIISIANRNLEQVKVVSSQLDIELPLSTDTEYEIAESLLNQITDKITHIKNVKSCNYIGINNIGESSFDYLIRIQCDPAQKFQTKRDAQVIIIKTLESNNIKIPFQQIDIHNK